MAALGIALLCGATAAGAGPAVHANAVFDVSIKRGVQYALGVLCDPKPCKPGDSACEKPMPPGPRPLAPMPGCPHPALTKLTLDVYTPVGAGALGPRPGFVAIHSGGYAVNNEMGDENEMDVACRHFASRGFVAITMVYRLTNAQTGGALAPANWTGIPSPLKGWKGGFLPAPHTIYPAVRDSLAAIRWLRGHAAELSLDASYVGAGGWSAGACTAVFLASQSPGDFTSEMTAATDPAFASLEPHLNETSAVKAGVVWAGNGAVTDTIDALDGRDRYAATTTPLAMYRGSDDNVMTPWAQTEVQSRLNASGARCDLFGAEGVGHGTLFPKGNVTSHNGAPVADATPVLNHSFSWIADAMELAVL